VLGVHLGPVGANLLFASGPFAAQVSRPSCAQLRPVAPIADCLRGTLSPVGLVCAADDEFGPLVGRFLSRFERQSHSIGPGECAQRGQLGFSLNSHLNVRPKLAGMQPRWNGNLLSLDSCTERADNTQPERREQAH